jgi:hypothetical protein
MFGKKRGQPSTMTAHKTLELQNQTVYLEITLQHPDGKSSTSVYNRDDERISSEEGYLLAIKLETRDESLMTEITDVIEKYGFNTPLVDYENHKSFKRSQNVSIIEANQIFEEICYYLEKKFPKKSTESIREYPMIVQDTESEGLEDIENSEIKNEYLDVDKANAVKAVKIYFIQEDSIIGLSEDYAREFLQNRVIKKNEKIKIPYNGKLIEIEAVSMYPPDSSLLMGPYTTIYITTQQEIEFLSNLLIRQKRVNSDRTKRLLFADQLVNGTIYIEITLQLQNARESSASWYYGTDRKIGSGHGNGYLITVNLENKNISLMTQIGTILERYGFSSMVVNFKNHKSFKSSQNPTTEQAIRFLDDICNDLDNNISGRTTLEILEILKESKKIQVQSNEKEKRKVE